MNQLSKLALLLTVAVCSAFAQLTTTSTTLSVALPANTVNSSTNQVCLASATGVVLPAVGASGTYLMVEKEAAQVLAPGTSATCFVVRRGVLGTSAKYAHALGATVWIGNAAVSSGDPSRPFNGAFIVAPPSGTCVASAQYTLPVIVTGEGAQVYAGEIYRCTAGYWTRDMGQAYPPKPFTAFTTLSPANAIASNSTSYVSGSIFFSQLYVPTSATLTGACLLNGATVGTNSVVYALYDGSGALVANTLAAGTTTATASKYQCIAFTATVSVSGPSTYFIAVQGNGTTDNFQTYAANSAPTNYGANSQTGTFGTFAPITPTVTFSANKGPIMMVY